MNKNFSKETVKEALDLKLSRYFGVNAEDANQEQIYKATILTVKDILTQKRSSFKHKVKKEKAKKTSSRKKTSLISKAASSTANTIGREIGKKIVRGLFDTFLK